MMNHRVIPHRKNVLKNSALMTFDKRLLGPVDFIEKSLDNCKPYNSVKSKDLISQKKASNERIQFLFELDKKHEKQWKKDYEVLEARKKQQEEETQKRISIKRALAGTDYISKKNIRIIPGNPLNYCGSSTSDMNKLVFSYNYLES